MGYGASRQINGSKSNSLAAARVEEVEAYLLLDEAFVDFVEAASMKHHLGRFPRLLILRSFTKFFGIPGMRLGFYYSPPDMHHPGYRDTTRPVTANWLA